MKKFIVLLFCLFQFAICNAQYVQLTEDVDVYGLLENYNEVVDYYKRDDLKMYDIYLDESMSDVDFNVYAAGQGKDILFISVNKNDKPVTMTYATETLDKKKFETIFFAMLNAVHNRNKDFADAKGVEATFNHAWGTHTGGYKSTLENRFYEVLIMEKGKVKQVILRAHT